MPLSKKSLTEFRELLTSWTLRQIDDLFQSEDIPLSENYDPKTSGQRRTRIEQYLHSPDLANQGDVAKVLRAIEYALVQLSIQNGRRPLDIPFLEWLRRDGVEFHNGRLVPLDAMSAAHAAALPLAPIPTPEVPPAVNPAALDSSCPPTAFVSYSWPRGLGNGVCDPSQTRRC